MKGSLEFLGNKFENINMLFYGHRQRVVFYSYNDDKTKMNDKLYLLVHSVAFSDEYFELSGFRLVGFELEDPEEGTACVFVRARFRPDGTGNCSGQDKLMEVSS